MVYLWAWWGLLAERDVFREMGAGIREKKRTYSGGELLLYAAVVVVAFAALGWLTKVLGRKERHQTFNNAGALFQALCKAQHLDAAQRRLLSSIAKAYQIESPAQLFLDPDRFAAAASHPSFVREADAIRALSERLFAERPTHAAA